MDECGHVTYWRDYVVVEFIVLDKVDIESLFWHMSLGACI